MTWHVQFFTISEDPDVVLDEFKPALQAVLPLPGISGERRQFWGKKLRARFADMSIAIEDEAGPDPLPDHDDIDVIADIEADLEDETDEHHAALEVGSFEIIG